jgi:hypothetical protein
VNKPNRDCISNTFLRAYPERATCLFFEKNQMKITKLINGEFITKDAMRNPNYSGFSYDWVDVLNEKTIEQ